jgi:FMN-dependent NADH-azoreductase
MAKLFHIKASPRGSRSASQAVASRFIESYRATHANDIVDTLDLWRTDLPEINGAMLDAAYAVKHGHPHSPEQFHIWQAIVRIADHFKSADKYLLSLPMWNFSILYKLKHYIDLLVHRGLTFSFTPEEGYRGLVTGKPLVAVCARGGAYGPGSGAEAWISRAGIWSISSGSLALPRSERFSSSRRKRRPPQGGKCGRRESPSRGEGKEFLNRLPGAECQINGASNVISMKPEEISR